MKKMLHFLVFICGIQTAGSIVAKKAEWPKNITVTVKNNFPASQPVRVTSQTRLATNVSQPIEYGKSKSLLVSFGSQDDFNDRATFSVQRGNEGSYISSQRVTLIPGRFYGYKDLVVQPDGTVAVKP